MEKGPHKSRTVWFGLALILLGVIPDLRALLAEHAPAFMEGYGEAIIGVLVILLRFFTRKPIKVRG